MLSYHHAIIPSCFTVRRVLGYYSGFHPNNAQFPSPASPDGSHERPISSRIQQILRIIIQLDNLKLAGPFALELSLSIRKTDILTPAE